MLGAAALGGGAGEARPGEGDGGGRNLAREQLTADTTAFHFSNNTQRKLYYGFLFARQIRIQRFFSQRKAVTAAFFAWLNLNGKR